MGGGFGNYFIPIFNGSPEVVYPRINNLSIILLILSYIMLILSISSEYGAGTGWTIYPPLSTSAMSLSPSSTAYLTFINFWVTIWNLRLPSLTLKTMPLFPWAIALTAAMLLLTLPVLTGALVMVL